VAAIGSRPMANAAMRTGRRTGSSAKPHELAVAIGANCAILVEVILRDRRHPEQGFRACLGIMRLAKPHGAERLEAACGRALEINARSYASVKSILQNNLERSRRDGVKDGSADGPAISHANIRGAGYFH